MSSISNDYDGKYMRRIESSDAHRIIESTESNIAYEREQLARIRDSLARSSESEDRVYREAAEKRAREMEDKIFWARTQAEWRAEQIYKDEELERKRKEAVARGESADSVSNNDGCVIV